VSDINNNFDGEKIFSEATDKDVNVFMLAVDYESISDTILKILFS